jgi:hypothetical protein
MKPGSDLLFWIGFAVCCCILSACEPSPGKIVERVEWFSTDGSTKITAVRYAEGTWGNPAKGEHLEIFCKSRYLDPIEMFSADGTILRNKYFVNKLGVIPKERITIASDKIIYGTLLHDFFITMDGCKTIRTWNSTEDFNKKVKKIPYGYTMMPKVSYFKAVSLCPDGSIVLTVDESYLIDERELWAISTDGAKSWSYKDIRPKC